MVMELIAKPVDHSSDSESSIGTPGDSEEEEKESENDDVSKLASMSSLEDSLPTKKGLSNHYKGKSKSFVNLGEIKSVKEVEKQENQVNKQRRLQICNKLSRRSFYSWQNPKSMPLIPVNEDDDDDLKSEFDENKSFDDNSFKNRGFKAQSCFALLDLIKEEDNDDD